MKHVQQKVTWPVRWSSATKYVDIDTGEEITKHMAKTKYKRIKTHKYAAFTNYLKTKGRIEYTILCRSRHLEELPFSDQGENT